jgi:dienelactone hydrolase
MLPPLRSLFGVAVAAWMVCQVVQADPVQRVPAQRVEVPTVGLSSAPQALTGWLFAPTGTANHAAVVMLHGCAGAYARSGALNARHQMWGDYLAQQGYVVLMLDSFTPRGVQELCTTPIKQRTLKEADRRGDAYAALRYVQQLPGVQRERVGLLGWSHGGGVVLDAMGSPPPEVPGFQAAVAFYPGCSARTKAADAFHPYAPLLLIMGDADDWTPAAPCKALTATVQARGEPMQMVSYPDTFHDFDNPALKTAHVRKEVPNGVNPGQGVTVAPNAQAREDALQRVRLYFLQHLK